MKEQEKGNKGFSLVELIVVVLIMAIIAVALAPQILKWVNNSRISSDIQTKDTLVDLMQTTILGNEAAYAVAKGNGLIMVVGNGSVSMKTNPNGGAQIDYTTTSDADLKVLFDKFCENAGTTDISGFKTKNKDTEIEIKVNPDATMVSSRYYDSEGNEIIVED